ncbi:MAG: hypothetical protein LBK29_03235 [Oscillospiraceae bacterium]|jgi:hypothetical protein|nr:hypothetical protein [Oscillospiraceae bacterium]
MQVLRKNIKTPGRQNTILYKEIDDQKRKEFIAEIESLPKDSELYYADKSGFDEYYALEIENFWANVKRRLRLHMRQFAIFGDTLRFQIMCTIFDKIKKTCKRLWQHIHKFDNF